jgi:hypothetical protein
MEEVLGRDETAQVLTLAGLPEFIGNYPPHNLEKKFDFTYFTAMQMAFETAFGELDGEQAAIQIGRASFPQGLRAFGDLAGVTSPEFRGLAMDDKLRLGLPAMADIMRQFSDQISQAYPFDEDTYIYTLERCPMCWKRQAERAVCFSGQGLLLEALHWTSGGHTFRVEIESCVAKGDEMGRYVIYREPLD